MHVSLTWQQVAVRLALALIASFLIGYDRDERGKSTGIRTTMLVCLAATLAMLQTNLLMTARGKAPDSFVVLDLMRLPLGILSGIGFIGAGAIIRKDGLVRGVTTAATLWFVTILGLLFGGGQLWLAVAGSVLALLILAILKKFEERMTIRRSASLTLELITPGTSAEDLPDESEIHSQLEAAGFEVSAWNAYYTESTLSSISCELRWPVTGSHVAATPLSIVSLAHAQYVKSLAWRV